jgi:hypothetical protein
MKFFIGSDLKSTTTQSWESGCGDGAGILEMDLIENRAVELPSSGLGDRTGLAFIEKGAVTS